MYYYHVVFKRPFGSRYTQHGQLTYTYSHKISVGTRVIAPLGSTDVRGIVVACVADDNDEIHTLRARGIKVKEIKKTIDAQPLLHEDQLSLALWMSEYYLATWGECLFTMLPSAKQERELQLSEEIISHFETTSPSLTGEQNQCIDEIKSAISDEHIDMCYVCGITGSGKTEVFIACMKYLVSVGKQVIYLLPEIALVQQCYPLFSVRFGKENLAIMHSRLNPSQRLTEWNRIKSGAAKIVLGVRSAVFAPVQSLGVVIIDEEHDTSYKSETTPRYHVRQVALKRCEMFGATLLMGSATPSLEAWSLKNKPYMKYLELKKRVAGGVLPVVELISLKHTHGSISALLQQEMQEVLDMGKQVLLLINRRGFSRVYLCLNCGSRVMCPNCSVNLVYHVHNNAEKKLHCHYCGYTSQLMDSCPHCNFTGMGLKGWGTQRLEEELTALFPHTPIGRIDADVAKDKLRVREVLGKFYRGEIKILVGTQILAKGANFPLLQLVGIVFADSLFGLPDFRAEERAFGLMMQVSGRAGRFSKDAKVIVQGYGIDNEIYKKLQTSDIDAFYTQELQRRELYGLAPFYKMLRVVFRGQNREHVARVSHLFLEHAIRVQNTHTIDCNFLGPSPCVLERIANNYRYHLLCTSRTQKTLGYLCRKVIESGIQTMARSRKVYIEFDVAPLNIL